LLEVLIRNISTLASVYHKPPETFVSKLKPLRLDKKEKKKSGEDDEEEGESDGHEISSKDHDLLDLGDLSAALPSAGPSSRGAPPASSGGGSGNLLDDFFNEPVAAPAPAAPQRPIVLTVEQGGGMQINASFARRGGAIYLDLTFFNYGQTAINGIAFQFNKNSFQLAPASQPSIQSIFPGQNAESSIPISTNGPLAEGSPSSVIQIAVKNNVKVSYFQLNFPYYLLCTDNGTIERNVYLGMWKSIPDAQERVSEHRAVGNADFIASKLRAANVYEIARRQVDTSSVLYLSSRTDGGIVFLIELTLDNRGGAKCAIRTSNLEFVPLFEQSMAFLLQN